MRIDRIAAVNEEVRLFRSAAEEWRAVFDALNSGVAVITPEGKILRANKAMADLLGRSFQEIIGQPCFKLVHGTDKPIEGCPLVRMKQTRRRESMDLAVGERWLRVTVDPLLDKDGNVLSAVHIIEDQTEQKRQVLALRESEEKYRSLVNHANDGIFIVQDGRIRFPNPKFVEISGYSEEELTTRAFTDFIHEDHRQMLAERYRRRMAGEALSSTISFKAVNGKGETRWIQLNATTIQWEGRPATLNVLRDVTHEREMQARLDQVSRLEALGSLSGGVAHLFNNSLTAVLGYLDLLEMQLPEKPRLSEYVKPIKEAALRMVEVVRRLLAYGRGGKVDFRRLSLREFIQSKAALFRTLIKPGVELITCLPEDSNDIQADPAQVQMLVTAIVANADEAIEKAGIIRLSLGKVELNGRSSRRCPELGPGRYVCLTVEDNGKGMDEKTRERIFEPFFTTKFPGRGLGMAAAYGIARSHDGTILVDSEQGKGTVVRVYFPEPATAANGPQESLKAL